MIVCSCKYENPTGSCEHCENCCYNTNDEKWNEQCKKCSFFQFMQGNIDYIEYKCYYTYKNPL